MRKTFVLFLALASWLAPPSASAKLHVDLGDPATHEFTVTYRFVDSDMGSKSMDVLPYEAEIEILEVIPDKGGRALPWEPIEGAKEGEPKIRVEYPETIKPGERFAFRMVARLTDENAYFEDTAKLNFIYRTGHEVSVSLPRSFYPIYSDEPMELIQESERVVLSSGGGKVRPIVVFAVRCGPGGPSRSRAPVSTAPEGASTAPEDSGD